MGFHSIISYLTLRSKVMIIYDMGVHRVREVQVDGLID